MIEWLMGKYENTPKESKKGELESGPPDFPNPMAQELDPHSEPEIDPDINQDPLITKP